MAGPLRLPPRQSTSASGILVGPSNSDGDTPSTSMAGRLHLLPRQSTSASDIVVGPSATPLEHMFLLVFWTKAGESPTMRAIQHIPNWPHWNLFDDIDLLSDLGLNKTTLKVDFFDTVWKQWIQAPNLYFTSDVSKLGKLPLLIRQRNLEPCLNFKSYADRLAGTPEPSKANTNGNPTRSIPARTSPSKRPWAFSLVSDTSSSESASESPSKRSRSESHPALESYKRARSESESVVVLDGLLWPFSLPLHVVIDGFIILDELRRILPSKPLSECFHVAYGNDEVFVKQVYQDARRTWNNAPHDEREALLEASRLGDAEEGTWNALVDVSSADSGDVDESGSDL